jgi:hypothetical protein
VTSFRAPTLYALRKAIRTGMTTRVPARPGVVEDVGMCGRSLNGNREISRLANRHVRVLLWSASGRRAAVADEVSESAMKSKADVATRRNEALCQILTSCPVHNAFSHPRPTMYDVMGVIGRRNGSSVAQKLSKGVSHD